MTTQAKEVHVVDLQHPGVSGAVRRVAEEAAFVRLYRCVLEDVRAHGVGVAFGTDGKLSCSGTHLMTDLRAVRIVAIATLHQPDVDAVTVRASELCLLRGVAPKTQFRLRFRQHEIYIAGLVWTMA
jgi:hypothetical protein